MKGSEVLPEGADGQEVPAARHAVRAAQTPAQTEAAARRRERLGALAAAAGAILFGSSYVATAFVLRSFTPLSTAFWRGALGGLLMIGYLAVAAAAGRWPSGRRSVTAALRHAVEWPALWRTAALGILVGPCFIVGLNVAVSDSGAAIASFVAGLYAVLAALFAPFVLREPLRRIAVAGFALSLAGTALLTGYQPQGSSLAGIAAGLFAAVTFGLYLVLGRRWSGPWGLDPRLVTLAALLLTAIVLLAIELAREPAAILPAHVREDALVALVYLVVMVSVVAALLVLVSVSLIPASRSSAFLLLNPPSAAIAAWFLLGESFNGVQLVGAVLVLAGIGLATIPRRAA